VVENAGDGKICLSDSSGDWGKVHDVDVDGISFNGIRDILPV
jgi:hypothetical protein